MGVRHYRVMLTTAGPVHVGCGTEYGPKDYLKLDERHVGVIDARRFVGQLGDEEREEYVAFLLGTGSDASLEEFLRGRPRLGALARECLLYTSEMRLSRAHRGTTKYEAVKQCVKDAHGRPYVPGSSLKGMLRTALLTHLILADPGRYAALYDSAVARGEGRGKACGRIEREAFWRERHDTEAGTVEADVMRYVSVSDSSPLEPDDLVFAKKYDRFARGDDASHKLSMGKVSRRQDYREGNELNVYRECIRPGTTLEFALDVDERVDAHLGGTSLDAEGLASVLSESFDLYRRCFVDEFDLDGVEGAGSGAGASDDGRCRYVGASGLRCRNRSVGGTGYCNLHKDAAASAGRQVPCTLGGGTDFDSKTVVNALFAGDGERLGEISRILYAQFPTRIDATLGGDRGRRLRDLRDEAREEGFEPEPFDERPGRGGRTKQAKEDHRHWKDARIGVSPHTLKLGIVGDKRYVMGRCLVTIEEDR